MIIYTFLKTLKIGKIHSKSYLNIFVPNVLLTLKIMIKKMCL